MEPVAGIPHGGFYEGGRAQEANSFKARPYPPLKAVPALPNTNQVRVGGDTPGTESQMEHTLFSMRITLAPLGVFMTASEANRQRVLTLLLAKREPMCSSVWVVNNGPVGAVSRTPIGWSAALLQSFPVPAAGSGKP